MSDGLEPTSESITPEDLDSFLGDISNSIGSDYTTDTTIFATGVDEDIPATPIEEPAAEPFADATTPIGDGTCRVCGAPTFRPPGLTKAGYKKRAPRYCDLHTPHTGVQKERSSIAGLESQLARIQQELADDMLLLGTMAGPLLPVTGYYICDNADAFTTALLKLCKNNQRMLRILHRAASVAPVYEVMKTSAGVAYSVQVDRSQADPHNIVGQRLGVSRAHQAVYGSDNTSDMNTVSTNGFTAPPHYAGVQ